MSGLKVDVITLDAVQNYGSVLQAYATQRFLEKKGCDVTVINYVRDDVRYEKLLDTWSGGNPVKKAVMLPTVRRWRQVFDGFRHENLHLTERQYTSEEDFASYPLTADAYCTGSDQVWNCVWNRGVIPPLYLSFVPADSFKFAFAASFGRDTLPEEEVCLTRGFIKEYACISVRESSGVSILKKQYGYENAVDLIDPTLTVSGEEWRELCAGKKTCEPYILIYNLNRSREFDDYAVSLAGRTGLKLVRICTRYDQFYRPGKSVPIPDLYEFISLIDHASFVLTDSFHATAFSMNMDTEPICVYPKEFGGRIENFLTLTGQLQRHIADFGDFDVVSRPVDFDVVHEKLREERERASAWMDQVLAAAASHRKG